MRLLFVTPQPPFPADQGTKLRNAGLIRIAAEAGHEVDLLSFGRPGWDDTDRSFRWCRRVRLAPLPPRRRLARRCREMALTRYPDLLLRLWSPDFETALQSMLAEDRYDAIQVEGLELALYLRVIRGVPIIFDDHNVEWLLQLRAYHSERRQPGRAHAALYSFVQYRRLRNWEARVCARAEAVLAVSECDAAALQALSGRRVEAVPNGIDLSSVPYREPIECIGTELLFDGTMSFRPNHDAARWLAQEIMPLVRQSRPDARAWIVGRDPAPSLAAFNRQPHGVAVTGTVPSVAPYWERAGIYVLPMRMGGGIRFKALEAMARGLPIVSTALGMEGTGAEPDRDYLRAETAPAFAARVVRLLDDPALRRRLAASARKTVAGRDWARIGPDLLAVYEGLGRRS